MVRSSQDKEIEDWVDLYGSRALAEVPANRPAAEKAYIELYRTLGLPPPQLFMWVKSPKVLGKVRRAFNNVREANHALEDFTIVEGVGSRLKERRPYWDDPLFMRFLKLFGQLEDRWSHSVGGLQKVRNFDTLWTSMGHNVIEHVVDSMEAYDDDDNDDNDLVPPLDLMWGNSSVARGFLSNSGIQGFCGPFGAPLACVSRYMRVVKGADFGEYTAAVDALVSLVESSCLFLPYRGFVVACERPTKITLDDRVRAHNTSGPALLWPDGFGIYMVAGIKIPEHYITKSDTLTIEVIDKERNAEVRRVYLGLYGEERYLKDTKAKIVSYGSDGAKLWCRVIPPGIARVFSSADNEDRIQFVEVVNSTPEPDGSIKHYFLRVPPTINNADEAVAWTFRLTDKDYDPEIET